MLNKSFFNLIKVILTILLMFIFLPNTWASEKSGATVIVRTIEGNEIEGELITVKPNSILLLDFNTNADHSVLIEEIYKIKVIKKARPWKGAWIGFATGFVAGAIYGRKNPGTAEDDAYYVWNYAFLCAPPAALFGAIIAGLLGLDKTYLIKGRPPHIREEFLKKLRSQARVKDFN